MVFESGPTTYTRMNPSGPSARSYVRIRFSHDKVTRSHVVHGVVIDERDVTAEYVKQAGGSMWMKREEPGGV